MDGKLPSTGENEDAPISINFQQESNFRVRAFRPTDVLYWASWYFLVALVIVSYGGGTKNFQFHEKFVSKKSNFAELQDFHNFG